MALDQPTQVQRQLHCSGGTQRDVAAIGLAQGAGTCTAGDGTDSLARHTCDLQ